MRAKRIFFGIAVGVLLGLVFDGFLLIYTSGWLVVFLFPIVIPPLFGMVLGIIVGWKGIVPAPSWAVIAVILLIWPIGVWGPIKFQEFRFRRFVTTLPIFPQSERQIKNISVLGGDDPPSVSIEFRSTANASELVDYYRAHLIQRGWKAISAEQHPREWQFFSKGNYTIDMIGFDSDQAGENDKYDSVRITRKFNTLFYGKGRKGDGTNY